jgi:hypothetical protein
MRAQGRALYTAAVQPQFEELRSARGLGMARWGARAEPVVSVNRRSSMSASVGPCSGAQQDVQ